MLSLVFDPHSVRGLASVDGAKAFILVVVPRTWGLGNSFLLVSALEAVVRALNGLLGYYISARAWNIGGTAVVPFGLATDAEGSKKQYVHFGADCFGGTLGRYLLGEGISMLF